MNFGIFARQARQNLEIPVKEAADRLHMTRQTLFNMESGDTMPDPQNVVNMACLYNEPGLLNAHCKLNCPIGRRMNYTLPDRLPKNITAITVRNMKESEEHVKCLKEFAYSSVLGSDKGLMRKAMKQILEAEYWIETLKVQLIRDYGMEEVEGLIREVNTEYIAEGLVCI